MRPPANPHAAAPRRWRGARDERHRRTRRLHAVGPAWTRAHRHPAPAGSALARRRHRFGVRRARPLRPLPGAAGRGRFREARRDLARGAPVAVRRGRAGILPPPADGAGTPAVVLGFGPGRPRDRRAVRQPGAPAGGAQGRRSPRHRARSRRPPALRRGAAARHARSFRRSAPAGGRARLRVAVDRTRLRRTRAAAIAAGAAQGRLEGDGGRARRQPDHRRVAGLSRARVRHRDRRGLDDDRRASCATCRAAKSWPLPAR